MKKSNRFKPIAQVAKNRETQAAQAVSQAQFEVKEKCSRLDQLQMFYGDYLQQFEQQGKTGFDTKRLQSFRGFLHELNKAIEQQKKVIKVAQRLLNEKKQQWLEARKKVKVYKTLVSNYQQEERYQEDKQEQAALDEHTHNIRRNK